MSEQQQELSPQHARVLEKCAELEDALNKSLPGFPHILKDIHETLRADPEIVTLLAEEDIAKIVKGMEMHAHIVVTPAKAKKAATAKSKVPIKADDL